MEVDDSELFFYVYFPLVYGLFSGIFQNYDSVLIDLPFALSCKRFFKNRWVVYVVKDHNNYNKNSVV